MARLSSSKRTTLGFLRAITEIERRSGRPKEWKYNSSADFILQNGRWFDVAPLPPTVKRGRMGECYKNAADLIWQDGYTYVEGVAYPPGLFPALHAWCVNSDGQVIDSTWEYNPKTVYLGVPFKREFVSKVLSETHRYGIIGPEFCRRGLLLGTETDFLAEEHR